jgi:hypothetical protein
VSFVTGIVVGIAGVFGASAAVVAGLIVAAMRVDRRRAGAQLLDDGLPPGVMIADGDGRSRTVEWWCMICGTSSVTGRSTMHGPRFHKCGELHSTPSRSRGID